MNQNVSIRPRLLKIMFSLLHSRTFLSCKTKMLIFLFYLPQSIHLTLRQYILICGCLEIILVEQDLRVSYSVSKTFVQTNSTVYFDLIL